MPFRSRPDPDDVSNHGSANPPASATKRKDKSFMSSLKKLLVSRQQRAADSAAQLISPVSNASNLTPTASETLRCGAHAPPRSSTSMPLLFSTSATAQESLGSSGLPSPRFPASGRRIPAAPSSSAVLQLPYIDNFTPPLSSGAMSDRLEGIYVGNSPSHSFFYPSPDVRDRTAASRDPAAPAEPSPLSRPDLSATDRASASVPLPLLRVARPPKGAPHDPPTAALSYGSLGTGGGCLSPPAGAGDAAAGLLSPPSAPSPAAAVTIGATAPVTPKNHATPPIRPSPAVPGAGGGGGGGNPSTGAGQPDGATGGGSGNSGGGSGTPGPPSGPSPPGTAASPSTLLAVCPGAPEGMRRPVWRLADYSISARVYKGEVSSVYKATCLRSGTKVALKVYSLNRVAENAVHTLVREVKIHTELSHNAVLMMYGVFEEENRLVLVLERASCGDLFQVHRSLPNCRMNEDQLRVLVLAPLLDALCYLHARGICHRDIKPENILMTGGWQLKLADFGAAINLAQERAVTRTGTVDYMAPEVERCPLKAAPEDNKDDPGLAYTTAADVWSLGVLSYELLVGFPPFIACSPDPTALGAAAPGAHHHDAEDEEADEEGGVGLWGARSRELSFPHFVSAGAQDFIAGALVERPGDRPTAAQLMRHPWLKHAVRQYQMRLQQQQQQRQVQQQQQAQQQQQQQQQHHHHLQQQHSTPLLRQRSSLQALVSPPPPPQYVRQGSVVTASTTMNPAPPPSSLSYQPSPPPTRQPLPSPSPPQQQSSVAQQQHSLPLPAPSGAQSQSSLPLPALPTGSGPLQQQHQQHSQPLYRMGHPPVAGAARHASLVWQPPSPPPQGQGLEGEAVAASRSHGRLSQLSPRDSWSRGGSSGAPSPLPATAAVMGQ